MTDFRGHEPMLYEVVKPMEPGEFLGMATKLGDRADDLTDFSDRDNRPFDPEAQKTSEFLEMLADVALANVTLAEADNSPDATAVRILRALGKHATWHVERARSVAGNLSAVDKQLTKEPQGPFLILEEQEGGVLITAGRTNGMREWGTRIGWFRRESVELIPELRIGREPARGEARLHQFIAHVAEARVVTDDHLPTHLIHDSATNADTHARSGRSYEKFLSSYFGKDVGGWGIDDDFPQGAVMIGLGTKGVDDLLAEYQRLTESYYHERPLGKLELQRLLQEANTALGQVDNRNLLVKSGPHYDLRKSFEESLDAAFVASGLSESDDRFEEVIWGYYREGKSLPQDTLDRIIEQAAHGMFELNEGTVSQEDLLVAVRAEIEQIIQDAQGQAAQ